MPTKHHPNSLRKIRLERGYNQLEAAEIMGFRDAIQLSRWEQGERLPNLLSALKLSAAYSSSVDFLFHDISFQLRKDITTRRETVDSRKKAEADRQKYGPIPEPSSNDPNDLYRT